MKRLFEMTALRRNSRNDRQKRGLPLWHGHPTYNGRQGKTGIRPEAKFLA